MKNITILFTLLLSIYFLKAQGPVKIINAPGDSIVIDSSRIAVFNPQNNIFLGKDAGRIHPSKNSNIAIGIQSQGATNMGGGNVSIGHNSLEKIEGNRNIALGNSSGFNLNSANNNILIGEDAGFNGTNLLNNVIIGDQAAYDITGGYGNSILGKNAGIGLTSGHSNVFIGASSGTYAKSGFQNIYVGKDAGFYNEGNQNVMIGQGSGAININSNFNAYIGMHAGRNIDSAEYNVIVGPFAGENAKMLGDSNVIIGPFAGKNFKGSQQLIIENSDSASPLIYGDFKKDRLTINGQLKVGLFSQYTLPAFSSGKGTFLKLSTDSTAIWTIPSIDDLSDGMNGHNNNLFLGYQRDTLAGTDNIGIGNGVLSVLDKNLPNNDQNIGIGNDAIRNLTEGNSNVAIGHWSMLALENGWSNTAVGDYALGYLKDGTYNTAIGNSNGLLNYGGNGNTFIGYRTGSASTGHTNNYSVHIGYAAGYNDTTDYKLHIGSGWPSKTLIYGDFANDSVRINGVLQISKEYAFPLLDGNSGQILQTNGNGQLAWVDKGGIIGVLSDADSDTKIEVESTPDSDIIEFSVAHPVNPGSHKQLLMDGKTFQAGSPGNSLFIGFNAGINDSDNGNANTFLGVDSGHNNETGQQNAFVGSGASFRNSFGNRNTSLGAESALQNETGNDNVNLGFAAGYENTDNENVFIGSTSGATHASGGGNVMLGFGAGENNIGGERNVFLGYQAGRSIQNSNTLIIDNAFSDVPLIHGAFDNRNLSINWDTPTNRPATLNINATLNLKPITNPPACNGDSRGTIYFDDDLDKLRVCTSSGWENMH